MTGGVAGHRSGARKLRILFVLGYPRAASYILQAIEVLASSEQVSFFCYRQMSRHERWLNKEVDIRPLVLERLRACGATDLGEPRERHSDNRDTYSWDFDRALGSAKFDLAIFDENLGKTHWGSAILYRILRRRGVVTIGCQEGSTEDDEQGLRRIARNLGVSYDYCFCFGRYDEKLLLRANPKLQGRLWAVGLPDNDRLKRYSIQRPAKRHVLLVPSYTKVSGPSQLFEPLTEEIIEEAGVYDIAERFGVPVLIKEKGKRNTGECAFGHLRSDKVDVSMSEQNLDEVVAASVCVIGAPSTLLFKPLQLRIPTAILGRPFMGRLGVFNEYSGVTDSTRQEVLAVIEGQATKPVSDEFIERLVVGGSSFSSTEEFVKAVHDVGGHRQIYTGPLALSGLPFREYAARRYPRVWKKLQSPYAKVRRIGGSFLKRRR